MTEAFTKPIVLTKENAKMIKKALSKNNRKKNRAFWKEYPPRISQSHRAQKQTLHKRDNESLRMTKTGFRNLYSCYKLADFLTTQSTNQVKKILKTFVCTRNADVEDFLQNKATTFEKYLRSRTYLYINNQNKKIEAYFSIGITYHLPSNLIRLWLGFWTDIHIKAWLSRAIW